MCVMVYNNRVQILTEELKYHSMLGIGLFTSPREIKVTRDRVFVLDGSEEILVCNIFRF